MLSHLPEGVSARDRELVPLSSTTLGVEATYDDGGQRVVVVVAGGYLDDLLEAYDELEFVDRLTVAKARATVLRGRFLGDAVRAAYWRAPTASAPCDVRAIVATNVDAAAFARVLDGVR